MEIKDFTVLSIYNFHFSDYNPEIIWKKGKIDSLDPHFLKVSIFSVSKHIICSKQLKKKTK